MGADISFVVETQVEPGDPWELATNPNSLKLDWYEDRAYECFSLLTGLDFSTRKLRPLTPIAPLRGWPEELSNGARARLTSWSDDTAYGQSWLSVADISAYDWNAPLTWTFMTSPPDGLVVTDHVIASVHAYVNEQHQLPPGWGTTGWSRDGFDVAIPTTPRTHAGRFLDVARDMAKLANGNPDTVRCVFEFIR